MSIDLPGPIDSFVQAENSGDGEAVAECFAPYGTVRDEDRYYEGRPAIKSWTAKSKKKYRQTVTPLEIRMSNGSTTLKAELSGDFPGSPVTANFHFALVDGQIGSLQIRN